MSSPWRVTPTELVDFALLSSQVNTNQFLRMANNLTDKVEDKDSNNLLSDADLKDIELNLAAHFAVQHERSQQYTSRSTDGASGSFQGQFGMGLESSHYGQNALMLDETGFLHSINKGKTPVGVTWLGKPVSEQTDYDERD